MIVILPWKILPYTATKNYSLTYITEIKISAAAMHQSWKISNTSFIEAQGLYLF